MRKLVFLFITLLTGYIGGAFRSVPLMALAGMELLLYAAAFFQSRYLKGHLSIEVLRHGEALVKSAWFACRVKVRNNGKLPASRFQVRLRYGYCRGAGHMGSQYIEGSCGRGECTVQFEVKGKYCGLMALQMAQLRAYDYLGLFSGSRKIDEAVEVAVYPQEKALCLELLSFGGGEGSQVQEQVPGRGGDADNEVRQLREYQSGDSSRYIHWNQSARTGLLWVKEYEREAGRSIRLSLDLDGMEQAGEAEADAFYELLSALVLGLLGKSFSVCVSWHDASGGTADMEICNAGECRRLLLCLYRRSLPEPGEVSRTPWEPGRREPGSSLKLDLGLGLYRDEALLYRFSAQDLEKQITGCKYIL